MCDALRTRSEIVSSILTLATILGAFAVVAIIAAGAASYVARDRASDASEIVSAAIAAISLFVSIAALTVAHITISHHQDRSLRQRQMETPHRLNEQYDAIFADIYRLRKEASKSSPSGQIAISKEDMRLIYSRYFTSVATGLRYCQLGLVPKEDFIEWTCNLIARFAKEPCIVHFDGGVHGSEIKRKWEGYEKRVYGPKLALRRYMANVWHAVEEGGRSRLAGQANKLSDADVAFLTREAEAFVSRVGTSE